MLKNILVIDIITNIQIMFVYLTTLFVFGFIIHKHVLNYWNNKIIYFILFVVLMSANIRMNNYNL